MSAAVSHHDEPFGRPPHLVEIPETGEEEASKGERDRDGEDHGQA